MTLRAFVLLNGVFAGTACAETVEAITTRSAVTVLVETPQPAELVRVLAAQDIGVEATGDRLVVRGTTKATVSQLAFESGIRLVELSETTQSLEDSLLDMTQASAEFASA